jgi:hypothetical protein
MQPNSDPAHDLRDLERRLAAWRPGPARPPVETLLYTAGQASLRPRLRLWIGLAGLLSVLSLVLLGLLIREAGECRSLARQLAERNEPLSPPEPAPASAPPDSPQPTPDQGYLTVRDLVLEKGVDAWQPGTPGDRPVSDPVPPSVIWHVGQRTDLLDF